MVGDPFALSYNCEMLVAIFLGGDRTLDTSFKSSLLHFRHVGGKKGLVLFLLPGWDTVCFGAPDADTRRLANTKLFSYANI